VMDGGKGITVYGGWEANDARSFTFS
jgi:hypothetical protein